MSARPATDESPAIAREAGASRQYDERRLDELVRFSLAIRGYLVIIVCVLAGLLWLGGATPALVLAWLLAALVVRELRSVALFKLVQRPEAPIDARLRQAVWWSLVQGLANGSAMFFLPQLDVAYGAAMTLILLCLSVGAVNTMFSVRAAFIAYAGTISLLTALAWMTRGTAIGLALGGLVLIFIAVQLRFARQNMELFSESYGMRLENMTLLRQLSEEQHQLAQARDAAIQANQSKSRFLAAASHDLRQPLQSMTLNIGALTRLQHDPQSREIAEQIGASVDALRQMLDALLDVSKLDAGAIRPSLQQLRMDLLVTGLCQRFRPAAESQGLRLHGDCTPGLTVLSDADILLRVLSNLIDNAIKFTPSGSITLSAFAQDGQVRVVVQDTGLGIPEADQDRVFEDLVQLDNPQRDRSFGHGLGLGIVRRLTRLLGIDCRLDSSPGEGTRFTLRLPPGDTPAPALPSARARSGDAAPLGRRVLVLDDDPAVRSAYANALQALGCSVFCTATLAEALDAVPNYAPEIALVDYRLAESHNGLQAIGRLREQRAGLPAVIVSADTSAALRDEAARHGVPMLRKPVTAAMLAAAIDEALATR